MNAMRTPDTAHRRLGGSAARHALTIAALAAALLLAAIVVHWAGATDSGLTYLLLLPVLAGAALYGLRGALALALAAGLLIGPYMPTYTAFDFDQPQQEWLIRMAAFVIVGAIAGIWRERTRREIRLREEAARIDPTSGLPNGVAFVERLESALKAREANDTMVAAALLRATDLAEITDVTGVEGGDRILHVLAERLRRACPEIVGAYRFSASELAMVIEVSDSGMLRRVARDLHDASSSSFEVDQAPVRIEPAIGLGHPGPDSCEALEVVRRARVALRRARAQEKDWVSYEPAFDEGDTQTTLKLIAQVEDSIRNHEFELHYQPKIHLGTGDVAGAEALARWRRPDGTLVPPGSFMPKLEQTSLIDTFSRFVVRSATDFARIGPVTPISVNFAPRNLTDETLIDELIDELRKTNTPPEALEVEITEGALMREPENAIVQLQKLRDHGIGVSIDDFGTGYSSFAYLRRLPATNLKIDREFIRPLEGDIRARRLVLAMIESGQALGMSVTAEGIETDEQARILTELGCDYGQGFLWSPAMPDSGLRAWVEPWQRRKAGSTVVRAAAH